MTTELSENSVVSDDFNTTSIVSMYSRNRSLKAYYQNIQKLNLSTSDGAQSKFIQKFTLSNLPQ